jgi:glycosyltransferase involved in cell wall biosynthesis
LNTGIYIAKGEYIARMDSDDIAAPERLSEQLVIFSADPSIGVCGSWVRTIDGHHANIWKYPQTHEEIEIDFLFKNPLAHPTVMMRRDLLRKHGLHYQPDKVPAEDYYMWYQLHSYTRFSNIAKSLLDYRLHLQQTSRHKDTDMRSTKNTLREFWLSSRLLNEDEFETNVPYLWGPWIQSTAFLEAAIKLYQELIQRNECLRRFEPGLFNDKLYQLFWRQCYFSCSDGVNGLRIYRTLSGNNAFKVPPSNAVKAVLKYYLSKTNRFFG